MKDKSKLYKWIMIISAIIFNTASVIFLFNYLIFQDFELETVPVFSNVARAIVCAEIISIIGAIVFAKAKLTDNKANKIFAIICAAVVATAALATVKSVIGFVSYDSITAPDGLEEEEKSVAATESEKYFPDFTSEGKNNYLLERDSVKGTTCISGSRSHGFAYEFEYIKTTSALAYMQTFCLSIIEPFPLLFTDDIERLTFSAENIDGTNVSIYQLDDNYVFRIKGFSDILFVTVRNAGRIDADIDTIKKAAVEQFNAIRQNEKAHTFVGIAV